MSTWAGRSDHTWSQWPGTWAEDLLPAVSSFIGAMAHGHGVSTGGQNLFIRVLNPNLIAVTSDIFTRLPAISIEIRKQGLSVETRNIEVEIRN